MAVADMRGRMAVNFPMVFRVMGWLLMVESAFMLIPLITCIIYGEPDYLAFLITIGGTLLTGAVMTFCLKPSHTFMAKREGFLLTAMVWVFFSFFGMVPFMLCEHPLTFTDAFFETMSGFSTTGATVFSSVNTLSHGINMWRCLTQWIGGMGIILFTLAVIPMLNHSGGMQMFNAEVTGITHEKIRPRISQTAKSLWMIYITLTASLCLLLWAGPMDLFDSICHAFSTMSTGGFSTRDNSIAAWDSDYIKVIITIFMFIGGVNFTLIYRTFNGDGRCLLHNDTFSAYIRVVCITYILFVIAIVLRGEVHSYEDVTIDPLFQIISTISSTGLTANNFLKWGPFVIALLFVLMFFGACAGSTSGGAKIDRMIFLLKNTRNELYRSIHPNAITAVRVNGNVVSNDVVNKVIAFLCIYVMVISVGGIVLTSFGIPIVDSFFDSFSCVSNIGLGAGEGGSFNNIPYLGKWVLSALMLIGRLELFTVLILFTKAFWVK